MGALQRHTAECCVPRGLCIGPTPFDRVDCSHATFGVQKRDSQLIITTFVFTQFVLWLAALGSGALQQPQCRVDDRLILYIYIYIYVYIYVCVYIYIYIHIIGFV